MGRKKSNKSGGGGGGTDGNGSGADKAAPPQAAVRNGAPRSAPRPRGELKKRVSFDLSEAARRPRGSVADANASENGGAARRAVAKRPKQSRLQTALMLGAMLFAFPRLFLGLMSRYCDRNRGRSLCRRRPSPTEDAADRSTTARDAAASSTAPIVEEKMGIFERVIERHTQKRKKKRKRKKLSMARGNEGQHVLRHLLEGALTFSHWKKHQIELKLHKDQPSTPSDDGLRQLKSEQTEQRTTVGVDWKKWKYAMSDDFDLTNSQIGLVQELARRVLDGSANNDGADATDGAGDSARAKPFSERIDSVHWGGTIHRNTEWWPRKDSLSEGGRLLAAYLKIMKWPQDLHAKFPFKLCAKGCDSEVAILHTLEWREKYLPWCMSPNAIQYNDKGFVYHRGHSRPGPRQRLDPDLTNANNAGHSMVWYRPGRASLADPELYIRSLIHTLEMAVADSLLRNDGAIGRFNLVVDCEGVGTKSIPSMAHVKKLFGILQDHFPDRLGVLLLANLSGVGRMVMNMVMPFVTEDVKAKIHIIPASPEKRQEMLLQFIDLEHVPTWVDGKDEYIFDSEDYYYSSVGRGGKCVVSEERISEYIVTMPYHA